MLILLLLLLTNIGACHDDCTESRCGRHGPPVRFPFRLKEKQPLHCGYPGFDLTCPPRHHRPLLQLSTTSGSVQLSVNRINYESQKLELYDPQGCLPRQILKLHNSSISPFVSESSQLQNITFLDCSSIGQRYLVNYFHGSFTITRKQDMFSCPIYAGDSGEFFLDWGLVSCTKILGISSNIFDAESLQQNYLGLRWLRPNCSTCEARGMKCKLKNNGTIHDIECLPHNPKIHKSTIIVAAGPTPSIFSISSLLIRLDF